VNRPSKTARKIALAALVALLCGASAKPGSHDSANRSPSAMADFGPALVSRQARRMADWITVSGDNHGMPFMVIDKVNAQIFVFGKDGHIRGAAPVLLGLARGDDIAATKGERMASHLRPDERITPAGRFVGVVGVDSEGANVLWVDYDDDIALHPVITTRPWEHRVARLQTPSAMDNRISYGCINVAANFFSTVVKPTFRSGNGVIYVLPENHPLRAVFSHYYNVRGTYA